VKILFSSWPGYGHLLPMIPLARAAARDGHQVFVASGSDLIGLIDRYGLPTHAAGPTLAESYRAAAEANRAAGLTELFSQMDPQMQAMASARNLFGASAVRRARDLVPLIDQWRPDLVVHDTLELGGPSAAQRAGIPHATHSYGPLVPFTGIIAPVLGAALAEAGLPDPIPGVFASTYLDLCPAGLQPGGTDPWTDVIAVRPSAGDVPVGESLPTAFQDLPHPTTVYLTLGTVTNEQPEVFRAVLDGCARHAVNVVMTTGPGVDPATVGGERPGVLALRYLSQGLVLPHCTAVVSHCGAGTMFGALSFGLPQLCLPQGTDQPFNALAVAGAGAGVVLNPDQVTADAVADGLDRVLGDPAVRSAALRLRAQIADMPEPADALRLLIDRTRG